MGSGVAWEEATAAEVVVREMRREEKGRHSSGPAIAVGGIRRGLERFLRGGDWGRRRARRTG